MPTITLALTARLRKALNRHFSRQKQSFDALVAQAKRGKNAPGTTDVWDDMPAIDSKAVARAAGIFKSILGIPFSAKAIERGGYKSVEDILDRFVPALIAQASKIKTAQRKKAG